MKRALRIIRQGDVVLIPTDKPIRGKAVPRERGRCILARGELTGHAHVILDKQATLFLEEDGSIMLAVASKPATLSHEEHRSAVLAPGNYEVHLQREYFPEEIRRVED